MAEQDFESLKGLGFESTSTYTLADEIGRGGMGIVFLAQKHAEGVTDYVVLKTLKTFSPEYIEMLKKEANIATGLRHENIVKTYGLEAIPYGELPASFTGAVQSVSFEKARRNRLQRLAGYRRPAQAANRLVIRRPPVVKKDSRKLYMLVMDYVEGTDLGDLHMEHLQRGLLLPVPLAAFAISRVCRALAYAHETCIHRDVSPENVLINNQGVVKLSDFGIAVGGAEQATLFAGKLSYMAPEQLEAQPADSRTDLYALGLVAYQILTGILLHPTPRGVTFEQQVEYVRRLKAEAPLPPHLIRRDIPEVLSAVVMKMMDMDPSRRYWRAEDAGNDLEQKVLYASGFGPTNNSLGAYLRLFDAKFQGATKDQLTQLRFLAGPDAKVRLARQARSEDFTKAGLDMVKRRPGTVLHARLFAARPGGKA